MKKIISATLALTLMSSIAYAADSADQATLQKTIDKLDVTSFNNSIGPRREKGKLTLKDYGASEVKFDGKKAIVSEPDNSWQFTITLLGNNQICFEDQAKNGGSYHSQDAYSLTEDKSGFLKASAVENTVCPAFAK